VVANVETAGSHQRLLDPGALALLAVQSVLVAGSLSFGVFPLLVDGFVRLGHLDVQSAGLCVTAEMLGQSLGGAGGLAIVRRLGSRRVVLAALLLIIVGNVLTTAVYSNYWELLLLRGVAGIGCGLTVVCIGLLAATKRADRNFAIFNTANLVGCAALAAAVPLLFRLYGLSGVFTTIAGAATFCLCMSRLIPDSRLERTPHEGQASTSNVPWRQVSLTCAMTVAYFVSISMFWSYAGDLGAGHHMGVAAVSSAVAQAWLVGGLGGSVAAMLLTKRLRRTPIVIVSAVGGAATTYGAVFVLDPLVFSILLTGFVFFWLLLYPIQMGLFSKVDPSGRLAMLAWFVQLIACAIGPALGGFVLRVSSFNVLAFACALGYVLFVCAALLLVPKETGNTAPVI
jgi:predicted MFS family arabinose efflux permease